ncbi:aldo/keto reductase [Methylobacterium sp. R2-1]|uniref:aldo/keto reductase n=1 Tax=Methylobacterium sp. R2-1 TaxID=2587064 RepID=UPI0017D10FBD|nr:aldo/keto reductase [Methylobacterium sp. R2-1]MBB2961849.1 aryl-alcohol dehydrogenase-like predicted oxidoreductase [Methylobacterium sp. R2-1]
MPPVLPPVLLPLPPLSRRTLLQGTAALAGLGLAPAPLRPARAADTLITRPIPSSGERLPAMGIGTSRRYEVAATSEATAPLREAVERFVALGGRVIDTAPSYGTAEEVLGIVLQGLREKIFLATKVAARGREASEAETERSFQRLRTDRIDLIAVHNLIDTETNLAVLRALKEKGRIRYVGVTVWRDEQFPDLEAVMKRDKLDFVQVNYALDSRLAAERILPLAAERGVAVMVNVPFGRDRLFKAVKDKPLPDFAADFGCKSWAQFFLKYVLANEAVTCPIPGMAKAAYVEDNLAAATGRLPDAAERRKMEAFIDAV